MDNYPTRKNRINLRNYRIDECEAKPVAKRYPRLKARSLNVMSSFRKFYSNKTGTLKSKIYFYWPKYVKYPRERRVTNYNYKR